MKIAILVVLAVAAALALARWTRRDERIEAPKGVSLADTTLGAEKSIALLSWFNPTERETGFFGPWKETRIRGVRVGFVDGGSMIDVVAGNFDADEEQITDIYMTHVAPGESPPDVPEIRLDRFVGDDGAELARKYYLNATGAEDYPDLRNEDVRRALLALSDAVTEIGILESRGVQISLDTADTTRSSLESDVRHAVSIASALQSRL